MPGGWVASPGGRPRSRTTFLPVGGRMKRLALPVSSRAARQQLRGEHARRRRRATTPKMPSLGDVLKQANAPTPAPPVPRAGLHKAFPKETRGIKKSAALQRHEPFAQHPEWAPRDYRKSQSQAAFDAPTVSNAEKPTLSTEMLQRSSIAPHVTEKALTSTLIGTTPRRCGRTAPGPSTDNLLVERARRA